MNVVVLDGFTLNPGDLSWAQLEALGNCRIYERTTPGDVLSRASGAEVLLTNKTVLSREAIRQLDHLRYIGVLATGTNVVDVAAATESGIVVTNVPAYGTRSVAQATMALLLELTTHTGLHARSVREGNWSKADDWCYWEQPLVELDGLALGIVGLGRIGRAVADLGAAFGMRVMACTPSPRPVPEWIKLVELEGLLRHSDVVSLHCPLTATTNGLINAERITLMKRGSYLINTSRGLLLDEVAVSAALASGQLAGAAVDVLSAEPPNPDNPLLHAPNCIVTPHIAWATRAARSRLLQIAVDNVRYFLSGTPRNLVTPG